jgi:hypothetical protein
VSIWLFVRLGGIALGIITLLGFASGYMNVEFKPFVKEVLNSLQYFADFIVQPELIERALDYLRQHFAWVPKPEPHWKPIYTLSALFMMSYARRMPAYMIVIALVCSLVPAVFAGARPVDSYAVLFWPGAGFMLFASILYPLDGERLSPMLPASVAASVAFGYFMGNTGVPIGIFLLTVFVGALGLVILVAGLRYAKGNFWQRLQDPGTAIGVDVTATLGGALFLGWLFVA